MKYLLYAVGGLQLLVGGYAILLLWEFRLYGLAVAVFLATSWLVGLIWRAR